MQALSESPPTMTSHSFDSDTNPSYSPETDSLLSFTPMGTVDDFFNFEMLMGAGQSSSRGSSKSPSSSLWNLPGTPPTPPQSMGLNAIPEVREATTDGDNMFNLYGVGEKTDDLFAMFENAAMPAPAIMSSPELFGLPTGGSATAAPSLETTISPSMFAIDPALTASTPDSATGPSASYQQHSSAEEADIGEDDGDDDDEVSMDAPTPASSGSASLRVGGKGAHNRKGTVASGGIRKSSGSVPMTQAVRRDDEPIDDDDWRPTPEEYKKMSSKEKRQLRNKISARNFRVRRKEYINTLEGDIAQRDALIDAIRGELGSTKLENQTLRHEVDALKKALLKGGITLDLPPPASLSETVPTSATKKTTRKALLNKPNTQKDIPASPRLGNAFWGGKNALGGGITSVHTTLVPEFAPLVTEKLAAKSMKPLPLQENLNPLLNANPFYGMGANAHLQDLNMSKGSFDNFTDTSMFTFKNMDAYRYHLWNKMAEVNGQRTALPQQQNTNIAQNGFYPNNLAAKMQPHYIMSSKSSSLTNILSGNSSSGSSSLDDSKPSPPTVAPTAQQAVFATIASQTLVSKLSSAFWDAFSSPSVTRSKDWDKEKVRKVLEGKAVVRVVDVAPTSPKASGSVDVLEESMKKLAIGSQGGSAKGPVAERLKMSPEPCFMQGLRTGSSPLSSKKA